VSGPADLAPKPRAVVRSCLEALLATPSWNIVARRRHLSRCHHLLRGAGMPWKSAHDVNKRIKASVRAILSRGTWDSGDLDLATDLALAS
jgi:hypothetical protein